MAASIHWREEARDDLLATTRYIAEHNPSAAVAYNDDVEAAVARLAEFPLQGRPYDERYRMIVCRNHLIFYRYDAARQIIVISRVVDGRRDLPSILD